MQRAVGFGTRNAQRKTGQRRATGRAAVMCADKRLHKTASVNQDCRVALFSSFLSFLFFLLLLLLLLGFH
jgi:hypothetical protein